MQELISLWTLMFIAVLPIGCQRETAPSSETKVTEENLQRLFERASAKKKYASESLLDSHGRGRRDSEERYDSLERILRAGTKSIPVLLDRRNDPVPALIQMLDLHYSRSSEFSDIAVESLGEFGPDAEIAISYLARRLDELGGSRKWPIARQLPRDVDQILAQTPNLERLDLIRCKGLTPECSRSIAAMSRLRILVLESTETNDESLGALSELATLEELNLNNCFQLSDTGIRHLSGLKNLRKLHLLSCRKVTAASTEVFASLPHLEFLGLGATSMNAQEKTALQTALPNCRFQF